MGKKVAIALVILMLLSAGTVYAGSQIGVVVNGDAVAFTDASPFIDENNRTLVPLRAVGEAMGLSVEWYSGNKSAVFSKEYTSKDAPMYRDLDFGEDSITAAYLGRETLTFTIGENIALYEMYWYEQDDSTQTPSLVMGGIADIQMDTTAIIKDSRTYAPIRYLAETFRYNVGWANNTVEINCLYSWEELGITVDMAACWSDYQSWLLIADKESDIKEIDVLSVTVNDEISKFYTLTEEQKAELNDNENVSGNYLNGFTVEKEIEIDNNYTYKVKVLTTMKDGTQKFGYVDIYMLFDGEGGYL